MRCSRLPASLALCLALTGLSGCGGGDETDPSASSPSAASTSEETAGGEAVDICALVTPQAVGEVVGGAVTSAEVPGGGCTFSQDDPRATSITYVSTPYDEANGGLESAKFGVSSVMDDATAADVDLGDGAYVAVGTVFGGENQQGGGLVHVGSSLVQVTLIQGTGLSTDEVTALVSDALALAVDVA